MPTEVRKALRDSSLFHEVRDTAKLPPEVVALCADEKGRLAEPGGKWQATDVIVDDALPQRRLIWAAEAGEYYVMHYERGGVAHSFHVLVATFRKGNPWASFLWRVTSKRELKDYSAFLAALESNKLEDDIWQLGVTTLPTEVRKALQNLAGFHEVHTVKELPPPVVALCADPDFDDFLAEPDEKQEAKDDQPFVKRLIWAAIGGQYYVVHYQIRGSGYMVHMVLVASFKEGDTGASRLWNSVSEEKLRDYGTFVRALESGKLFGSPLPYGVGGSFKQNLPLYMRVVDRIEKGEINIAPRAVPPYSVFLPSSVDLPPDLGAASVGGEIYALRPYPGQLLVVFKKWVGRAYNMRGYLYIAKPLSGAEIHKDYYSGKEDAIDIDGVEFVLEKRLDEHWYRISRSLD